MLWDGSSNRSWGTGSSGVGWGSLRPFGVRSARRVALSRDRPAVFLLCPFVGSVESRLVTDGDRERDGFFFAAVARLGEFLANRLLVRLLGARPVCSRRAVPVGSSPAAARGKAELPACAGRGAGVFIAGCRSAGGARSARSRVCAYEMIMDTPAAASTASRARTARTRARRAPLDTGKTKSDIERVALRRPDRPAGDFDSTSSVGCAPRPSGRSGKQCEAEFSPGRPAGPPLIRSAGRLGRSLRCRLDTGRSPNADAACATGWPHRPQKREPSRISPAQCGQRMCRGSYLVSAGTPHCGRFRCDPGDDGTRAETNCQIRQQPRKSRRHILVRPVIL